MTLPETDDERLKALDDKLDMIEQEEAAEKARWKNKLDKTDNMGRGLRAGTELIVTTAIGTFMGLQLDKWLDTKPLFLIVFLLIGIGAGFLGIYRITMESDK